MKRALILHGIMGHAGIHWQQWLHDELTKQDYRVLMPNLSNTQHPSRADWLAEIKDLTASIDTSELIIIGHSLGVTAALDFIEQSPAIKALVSVSGIASDYGNELNSYFLKEKAIDFNKIRPKIGQSVVFFGDDDPYVTSEALAELAEGLGVEPIIVHNGGHLNTERGFTSFPPLLDAILKLEDK